MATCKADDKDTDNLETFRLLWLDGDVNNTENSVAQQHLRTIINYLETFVDADGCQQSIEQIPKEDRVVLIVSGQLGYKVVPRIHEMQQVSSIYVYCGDRNKHKQWADQFEKVKEVTANLYELIERIQSDHKQRMKREEPLGISIFSDSKNADQSSTGLNGEFVHFQILIDVLLRIRPNEKDKNELIALCEKEYEGNQIELSILENFAQNYSSSRAVWWYTKESFIYKILNKALRVQNIDLLFLLRFLIRDIDQQLRNNQLQKKVQVYRGQLMSSDELDRLQQSVGNIVSMNSFFSTSQKRQKAIDFLEINPEPSNAHLKRVLFEIDADPRVNTTKSFADVKEMSGIADEFEVLFMLGSSFRLNEVCRRQDIDEEWSIVRMSLCGDDKYDLHALYKHMKKQYETGETNLLSLGNVLRSMGKFDFAEKYYRRFLHELSSNDPLRGDVYHGLGLVAKAKGKLDKSLELHQKALYILMRTRSSDYVIIGNIHNAIGEVYRAKDDHNQALVSFKQAVTLFEQAHSENHPDMALFHDNIGISCQNQKNYPDALVSYAKSLIIRQKYLPSSHHDLAISFHNVGIIRLCLGQSDLAMVNFKRALEIRIKALPNNHPDIAMSYKNVGATYENKGIFEQAMDCFKKASEIYRNALSSDHSDVVEIQQDIERVSNKLKS